ncbi:hypothetical protein [Enterocloster citroniae]|nr:hypothetical protein [Enterocloster citroniae]
MLKLLNMSSQDSRACVRAAKKEPAKLPVLRCPFDLSRNVYA